MESENSKFLVTLISLGTVQLSGNFRYWIDSDGCLHRTSPNIKVENATEISQNDYNDHLNRKKREIRHVEKFGEIISEEKNLENLEITEDIIASQCQKN